MDRSIFSNLNKTWIFDLDGTLVIHNGYKCGEDTLLPGVKEFFDENIIDTDGTVWSADMNDSDARWNVDEYGDRSFMWEYR